MIKSYKNLTRLEAIFFDLDGTLVTSNLDFVKIRQEIGHPEETDILKQLSQLPADEAQRIKSILNRHEAEDASHAEALEGAKQLLNFCRQQNWPIAVITRNSRAMAELKLKRAKLDIDVLVSRDDAPAKPDPTAIDKLLTQHNLHAEQVMYLGDYLYDIQTARNSGLIAGLIDHGQSWSFAADADIVINSLPQLLKTLQKTKNNC